MHTYAQRPAICGNPSGCSAAGFTRFSTAAVSDSAGFTPASLAFRGSDTIVFTDLWKAGTLAALPGRPKHHSYIYEVPVGEVLR